ncbi:MAG TPA: SPFH domain-containing protein [Bacteroidales bacterium]|nr:SPFH domain-containing protein [Bacteroidales bacterium]
MEKEIKPYSGYPFLLLALALIVAAIVMLVQTSNPWWAVMLLFGVFISIGLQVVNPNQSCVLTLFGKYTGTIKSNGFFWLNPFYMRKIISLRARNFDGEAIKVNDKIGNPIMIGLVLVWKVCDTFKAAFAVDDYEKFVVVQSEAALRKLAGLYPYDNFDNEDVEITLRAGGKEVNHQLEREIAERLHLAGVEVIEARINYIAYAQEIAQAMLKRQQASAIIAARYKIVEGAVSMVEMALEQLSDKKIVELDEDKKATMVSNLMVVLCSDKEATPVLNTGSLYQ